MENKDFLKKINELTKYHYENSLKFKNIIDKIYNKNINSPSIQSVPFLPVSLFKEIELKSIPDNKIFKILNSSGTSKSKLSKIYLDKENASRQTKVLNQIVSEIIGSKRLPMILTDERKTIKDPKQFNAKTAAYLGFSLFGHDIFYLLEDGKINYEGLNSFFEKYDNKKMLIFGFTSDVHERLIKQLNLNNLAKNNFDKAILIHGGGWKKMEQEKISNYEFKNVLNKKLNINSIYNYYGLIEQTGSIFFEAKCGYFTTSNFSDVIIRGKNFEVLPENKKGFVQLISTLPTSYPGHSILTEDIGEIKVIKNCKCGKKNKHFLIHGRAKDSELRGCSDV
jgi:hypothetical protein